MPLSQPNVENTPVATPMPVEADQTGVDPSNDTSEQVADTVRLPQAEAVPPTKRSPESGVFKVENVPQLNEAMQLLNEVKDGDYAEFAKLAHRLVEAKLVATKPIKGHGCTYTVKRSRKAGETLPLSEAESKQLAEALNKKMDTKAMKEASEVYRAERKQKRMEQAIEDAERIATASYLRGKVTEGVLQKQGGKFMLTDEATDEISRARFHRKQGGQTAKAEKISHKDEGQKEIGPEDLVPHAIKKVQDFEGSYDDFERFVYQTLALSELLIKDLQPNYTVTEVPGLKGSKELCATVMKKKKELWKKEREVERKLAEQAKRQEKLRATLKELTN